jgi:hypothetical protein
MALLIVYAAATAVMAVSSITMPEHRVVSALFFLVGLIGTWRHYESWRRRSRAF